jgi:hypothetical protein
MLIFQEVIDFVGERRRQSSCSCVTVRCCMSGVVLSAKTQECNIATRH